MSVLVYNGVELKFADTDIVEQTFERDPSNVDYMFNVFRVRLKCIVHRPDPNAGDDIGLMMEKFRRSLSVDRRALTFTTDGGYPLIDIAEGGDDAHGPRVLYCNIVSVTEAAFLVQFGVEAKVREGCPDTTTTPDFLSLRWSESTSYDRDWLCTRRRSGYLLLSGQTADPDRFRGLITPTVPAGFRRESASYTLAEDGLSVKFEFTDKELMTVPPYPAVRLTGRMTESTALPGAKRFGEFSARMEGPKGIDKTVLLARLIRIGMSRVFASGIMPSESTGRYVIGGAISEDLSDDKNAVDIVLRWNLRPASQMRIGAGQGGNIPPQPLEAKAPGGPGVLQNVPAGGRLENIQEPNNRGQNKAALGMVAPWLGLPLPGCDPARGIAPPTRGTADLVKLFAAALRDACGTTATLAPATGTNEWVGTDATGARVTARTVPDLSRDTAASYADDPSPGVYDEYKVVSHYTHDNGFRVQASTKPGEKSVAVRLHNPTLKLKVEFTAKRTGSPPIIPDPKQVPKDWVYLGGTISPANLEIAGDGVSIVHEVSGILEFASLTPCETPVVAPFPPYLDAKVAGETTKTTALRTWAIAFPYSGKDACNLFCCPTQERELKGKKVPEKLGGQQVTQLVPQNVPDFGTGGESASGGPVGA